jgi:hypothetical protein
VKTLDYSSIDPITVKRLSARRSLVVVNGWLTIELDHPCRTFEGFPLDKPSSVLLERYRQYASGHSRASFELSFAALRGWTLRRGAKEDRQVILGGVYDRFWLARAMAWLRHTPPGDLVRLSAITSPDHGNAAHRVLKVSHRDWTVLLMCCAEGTAHGDDALPLGVRRAA